MKAADSYDAFAGSHRLAEANGFSPGPVTPLLTKGGTISPAVTGTLLDDLTAVIGRYEYGRFVYNVVFTSIPESQPFIPRLACDRLGRITDDTHYGFEVRSTRLWTESEKLNSRFKVAVSPFQDDNWLRQLFSPTFIDWLGEASPGDFSFELAYGSLLCSVEEDELHPDGLERLWRAGETVARRVRDESRE